MIEDDRRLETPVYTDSGYEIAAILDYLTSDLGRESRSVECWRVVSREVRRVVGKWSGIRRVPFQAPR